MFSYAYCINHFYQDEVQLMDWKQQLDRDVETLKAKANIGNVRAVRSCLPSLLHFVLTFYVQSKYKHKQNLDCF